MNIPATLKCTQDICTLELRILRSAEECPSYRSGQALSKQRWPQKCSIFVLTQSIYFSNYLLANFRGLALGWTRSRMDGIPYRSRISQPNTRWRALDEIYQIYISFFFFSFSFFFFTCLCTSTTSTVQKLSSQV